MKPVHELTTDEAVLELERVSDLLMDASPSKERCNLLARQRELEAWILMHQGKQTAPAEPAPTPTKDPDPMPKAKQTEEEKRAKQREYNRQWAARKAAEKKADKPLEAKPSKPAPVLDLPEPKKTIPAPEAVSTISKIRASIWALMAALEHMTPSQRTAVVHDLALLDAAAHAAHQLALGRLEVA